MRTLLAASVLLAIAAAAIPAPAEAYPASAWRSRPTGLDSVAACTKRGFKAMESARLQAKASGSAGVYGNNQTLAAYVICVEGGRTALIFCASTQKGKDGGDYTGAICETLWKAMA
ncbi:hypothetical protein [Usitatibacter palustris]|uniref:Uncharacterized protein n=1 Tax=Usitatibacter palustris TaxID=2732487 RepID=A0A6M4H1I2_9PROT|nr:hypothetical protein [Usitatibacter palustris]QJR13320.1 hypothetical protein DSM104440_00103 [Usitatibacter palustris]